MSNYRLAQLRRHLPSRSLASPLRLRLQLRFRLNHPLHLDAQFRLLLLKLLLGRMVPGSNADRPPLPGRDRID